MSRTGRPPDAVPPTTWKINLPSDLAAQVELLLGDPMRDKPKYGARSELIEMLVKEWLEKKLKEMRATKVIT